MNIRIIKADVIKSANAMDDIADAVAKLDLGEPMELLVSGFPGSESAGGAKGMKAEWKKDQDGWVKSARKHRQASVDAANHLKARDDQAAQDGARQKAEIARPANKFLSDRLGSL